MDVQAQRRADVAAALQVLEDTAAHTAVELAEATADETAEEADETFGEGEHEDEVCEDDATPVGHVDEAAVSVPRA